MISKLRGENHYLGKVACQHSSENTKSELYAIVDLGAIVVNVIIEHKLYGEITGHLNLKNRNDVDAFIRSVESSEVMLLSELTQGVHLHTIACRDKTHFEQVTQVLEADGILLHN